MTTRIARNPIQLPKGVEVFIEGQTLRVKGPKGEAKRENHPLVSLKMVDDGLKFDPVDDSKDANALTGTSCALAKNMIHGVSEGFSRHLKLVGVGYRAKAQGKNLDIAVGYSHPVVMVMPEGLTVETPSQTEIIVKGIDKQQVCQMAAKIRAVRAPEPYKGKGIRYADEHITLKEAKKK